MPVVLCLSFLSSTSFAAPTDTWNESFQRLSDELARARRNIVSNIGDLGTALDRVTSRLFRELDVIRVTLVSGLADMANGNERILRQLGASQSSMTVGIDALTLAGTTNTNRLSAELDDVHSSPNTGMLEAIAISQALEARLVFKLEEAKAAGETTSVYRNGSWSNSTHQFNFVFECRGVAGIYLMYQRSNIGTVTYEFVLYGPASPVLLYVPAQATYGELGQNFVTSQYGAGFTILGLISVDRGIENGLVKSEIRMHPIVQICPAL